MKYKTQRKKALLWTDTGLKLIQSIENFTSKVVEKFSEGSVLSVEEMGDSLWEDCLNKQTDRFD